ncbi:MAG: S8/S53 family peptidase [Lachnospiraceae bacterium]|nr:S8/S53 family peptidase [Lachnospiraceae bacterium]
MNGLKRTSILSALLLICMLSVTVRAADPGYWYYDEFGIAEARQEGLDGSGVKIADIDTLINPDVPWLAGADIVLRNEAITTYYGEGIPPVSDDFDIAYHATDMVSLIVGNSEGAVVGGAPDGIAPGATIYHYAAVCSEDDALTGGDIYDEAMRLALEDGVDIVLIPAGGLSFYDVQYPYFLEAIRRGIPIFVAHANETVALDEETVPEMYVDENGIALDFADLLTADDDDEICYWPGIVTVQAIGENRLLQSYSDVEDPGTDITAPGEDLWMQAQDWGVFVPTGGGCSAATSVAVAYCALAMQKWPDATGNQILQLMVRTATAQEALITGDPADILLLTRDTYEGYGLIDPVRMLATDPSVLPDVNPILYLDVQRAVANASARGDEEALLEPELLEVAQVLEEQLLAAGFERPEFLVTLLGEREEEAPPEEIPEEAGEEVLETPAETVSQTQESAPERAEEAAPLDTMDRIRPMIPLIVVAGVLIVSAVAFFTTRSKKKGDAPDEQKD